MSLKLGCCNKLRHIKTKISMNSIIKHLLMNQLKTWMNNNSNNNNNNNNNSGQDGEADSIIRNHVILSMGAGFIPLLLADILAVGALQLDMIRQLCRVYNVDFKETQGKAIISALTSSTLARAGARSFIKLIPGLGTVLGGATVSVFAGASTYAVGEVFKKHFASGGTILDFDTERLKKMYTEKFEKGKEMASDLTKKEEEIKETVFNVKETTTTTGTTTSSGPAPKKGFVEQLEGLAALKEKGVLNDEEFAIMKKKLIDGFGGEA